MKELEEKMQKTVDKLQESFSEVRAGRANPAILNKVSVEYYGVPTPISQVAGISVPEARMIVIQPWDMSILKEIEKAILASDIGLNPNNDGKVIRLNFPELTEERRKELAKDIKKKGESAKVAVRNIRRDAIDAVKKKGKAKLYVKASDKSPMRYVACVWKNTATKELLYGDMIYNRKKSRYEYTLSASEFGKKGKLRLICVEACDKYGNKTTLKNKKLPKLILIRK